MIEFRDLALRIVRRNEAHLCNDGADVQTARAVERLERFHRTTPLTPVRDTAVDLAGFGSAPVYFAGGDEQYLLLSEVAEALGVPVWEACRWAREEWLRAVEEQRQADEERGDDRLGWECLRDYCDLHLDFVADDPEAAPDADGRRWASYGDWLISTDRVPAFILDSPWRAEFLRNCRGLFAHAATKSGLADLLDGVQTYRQPPWDGPAEPTGETLGDRFRRRAEVIDEADAIEQARRGPVLDDDQEEL
ncbi:hypothetical protein BKA00_005819 [Actinomadura coerulea]|uniref:Uncharacterized protein n=1 Tax=Actinomadura coerulea TaxID=46159 RepID=A0A7X0G586_9ACTN|nr:hypothetical protein [Actinomadura coerulea]MBB6398905.1 hypothetical protein [Actinomadura coerulea]GGP98364.1 hypothetical protein GCM10010187_12470 [Actinomadura coerulea]